MIKVSLTTFKEIPFLTLRADSRNVMILGFSYATLVNLWISERQHGFWFV